MPIAAQTDMEQSIKSLIAHMGADPDSAELQETPHNVLRMLEELGAGYRLTEEEIFAQHSFLENSAGEGLIVLKAIPFHSLCEHHLLPFFGHCHIAYIPQDRLVGLGKLHAAVELYARRLQIQERLTANIADCLERQLQPQAVAVVLEAEHLCLSMRGPKKGPSPLRTQALRGPCANDPHLRRECLEALVLCNKSSALNFGF